VAADRALEGLGQTLRAGDFALVLAAPTIPAGMQRAIEYLNARGFSVFGLEVSYFAGDIEAFVPRLVVRPTLGAQIAGQDDGAPQTAMDAETYIAQGIGKLSVTVMREVPYTGCPATRVSGIVAEIRHLFTGG